jgi:sugar phosphate isomerase/epimerase
MQHTRRTFLKRSAALGALASLGPAAGTLLQASENKSKMKLGMVTYLWGQDWDLPTIIANCEKSGIEGVETRTTHAHGVEPTLSAAERKEVRKRFEDSPVLFVGPGTNECFDNPDPAKLNAAIEATKAFIRLSHDCGGTGVKVKPNSFHKGVSQEITIAQIARSLNVVGKFAGEYGQKIRLEVHGQCSPLPIMKQIMDQVDSPHVGVCWNCNGQDLEGEGLEHNFGLVKDRFGDTAHVREFDEAGYPYQKLIELLVRISYSGWVLLECRGKRDDLVAAYAKQRKLFDEMVANTQG